MRAKRSISERFWAKVHKPAEGAGCWRWTAAKVNGGYGTFSVGGRAGMKVRAHRFSWEMHHGAIPRGMYLLHLCDNPACVNPAHLAVGTQFDNMADMRRKKREARGEKCGTSKLTERDVAEAFRLRRAGVTMKVIAGSLGVTRQTISHVLAGNTWGHVECER